MLPEEGIPAYKTFLSKITQIKGTNVWFLQMTSINNTEKALTHLTFGMDYYPSYIKKEKSSAVNHRTQQIAHFLVVALIQVWFTLAKAITPKM